jgi:hypothetical protein
MSSTYMAVFPIFEVGMPALQFVDANYHLES